MRRALFCALPTKSENLHLKPLFGAFAKDESKETHNGLQLDFDSMALGMYAIPHARKILHTPSSL